MEMLHFSINTFACLLFSFCLFYICLSPVCLCVSFCVVRLSFDSFLSFGIFFSMCVRFVFVACVRLCFPCCIDFASRFPRGNSRLWGFVALGLWFFLLLERGTHFQKNRETKMRKIIQEVIRKRKMEPEEVRWQVWWVYEGGWWGQKAKMLKKYWFYHYFLKGQGRHEDANRTNKEAARSIFGPIWGQKNVIFDKRCFVAIYRIMSPTRAGNTFSEKSWNKNEKNHARSHRKEKNGARRG